MPLTLKPMPVTAELVEAFRRDGFVRLDGLLDPGELARIGERITALTIALNTDHRPLEERSTYDRAFLQVMNLWQRDEEVRAFVHDSGLARAAATLLGVDGVLSCTKARTSSSCCHRFITCRKARS